MILTGDHMPIQTKRWNDLVEANDGLRLLVTRYRPRGVRKEDETWDAWWPQLAPSCELHRTWYPKVGARISWGEFKRRYLGEMKGQKERIGELAQRSSYGETITLLCSNACTNPEKCHRTLLKSLIEGFRL